MHARRRYWLGIGIAVFGALLIAWMILAVGIIGEPDHPANLMYVAVPVVGLAGAVVARFRPRGMANAFQLMALVQLLVAGITIATGLGTPPTPAVSYAILNAILLAFWVSAARLVYPAPGTGDK